MGPLVSVIIPVYNSAKYLAQCIESVVNQTWANMEIIIVDDGSKDDSPSIAKSYENKNIKVIFQENKGASAARNRGLNEASGAYIQFLDADDIISPNKLESQLQMLLKHPGYICTNATIHFFEDENYSEKPVERTWVNAQSDKPADFLVKLYGGALIGPDYGGMIAVHSWLCPKQVLDKAGRWNEDLSLDDDGEYFCRVILESKGVKYDFESFNYYRKYRNTANNISGLKSKSARQSQLDATKLKMNHLLHHRNDEQARRALSRLFMEIAVGFYPQFPLLTAEAEKLGSQLDPEQKPDPFKSFPLRAVSTLFGWKTAKLLSTLKQRWQQKTI